MRGDDMGVCGSGIAFPYIKRKRFWTLCHRNPPGRVAVTSSCRLRPRTTVQYCSIPERNFDGGKRENDDSAGNR